MHTYMHHLADQQAANHKGQMQFNDNFYHYTLPQYRQDPSPYPWPTPEQFRVTVAWPGDRPIFQEEARPKEIPKEMEEEPRMMKTWQIWLIISLEEIELLSHDLQKLMNLSLCLFIALY